jgi:hypothetical protein
MLKPARELGDDPLFWQYRDDGLALFINPSLFEYLSLPVNPGELVTVGGPFHLKPLLSLLAGDSHFYVLAVSQDQVRLLLGTRYGVTDIELENVPEGIEEALNYDTVQKQLQWHTRAPGRGGLRMAVFHGHGVPPLDHKDNLATYFRQIDKGLRQILREEKVPLVVAGVEYLLPVYKAVNSYPHLLEEGIPGNPDGMRSEQLHEKALSLVEPYFRRAEKEALLQYGEALPRGLASCDVRQIVAASKAGRVSALFAISGNFLWGVLDEQNEVAEIHTEQQRGDVDLADRAAAYTFLNNGAFYAVGPESMPDQAPMSAIFRY